MTISSFLDDTFVDFDSGKRRYADFIRKNDMGTFFSTKNKRSNKHKRNLGRNTGINRFYRKNDSSLRYNDRKNNAFRVELNENCPIINHMNNNKQKFILNRDEPIWKQVIERVNAEKAAGTLYIQPKHYKVKKNFDISNLTFSSSSDDDSYTSGSFFESESDSTDLSLSKSLRRKWDNTSFAITDDTMKSMGTFMTVSTKMSPINRYDNIFSTFTTSTTPNIKTNNLDISFSTDSELINIDNNTETFTGTLFRTKTDNFAFDGDNNLSTFLTQKTSRIEEFPTGSPNKSNIVRRKILKKNKNPNNEFGSSQCSRRADCLQDEPSEVSFN